MDKTLVEAFESTDYLVCLDVAEWATIRIHQALPAALQAIVEEHDWGFITAWNPRSVPRDWTGNIAAQHDLLAALQGHPETRTIRPGIGIGPEGWHEPSLFVIGPGCAMLDHLAREHGQNAYVHGHGHEVARLRWLLP